MIHNLITFSGARGSGKDTMLSKVIEIYNNVDLNRIIPCSTREIRDGEIDGVHQHFMSEDKFILEEKSGKFIFTNPKNANGYRSGTLKSELCHEFGVVDITAEGARKLRDYVFQNGGRALSIMLYADYDTRYARVRSRQKGISKEELDLMMNNDPTDPDYTLYPFWFKKVENKDGHFNEALVKVKKIINGFLLP